MRYATVSTSEFNAASRRMVHHACPLLFRSSGGATEQSVFITACWVGKWRLAYTLRRNRALSDSKAHEGTRLSLSLCDHR